MDIISIVIGAALLGVAGVFVYRPFQGKALRGQERKEAAAQPQARRESLLSAIRDLDFDYKTGKVSEEDYGPLRAQLLVETAGLTRQEQDKDDQLEALIQSRRTHKTGSNCSQCDAPVAPGQHFCSSCGAPLGSGTCASCGSKIKPGDFFCTSCGKPLEIQKEAVGAA